MAPNDDPTEEREELPATRRELLERAGAAGVSAFGALFFGKLAEPEPPSWDAEAQDAEIVVVGAGLAGLTCAWRLQQAGLQADVYEAGSRVGGRCRTRRGDFADGQTVEAGGELIHETHLQIQLLAQELGLALDDLSETEPAGVEERLYVAGRPYSPAEARDDLSRVETESLELDRMSAGAWIEQNLPGGAGSTLGRLLALAASAAYGAGAHDQSSLNLLDLVRWSDEGDLPVLGPWHGQYRIAGGNDQLATRLAAQLGSQIHTGCKLVALELEPNGWTYRLSFSQHEGGTFDLEADQVVLALPFSSLRSSVDWANADLDPLKQTAIRELGVGSHSKLQLQFSRRHWRELGCNGATLADTGYGATWEATRAQPGDAGILAAFTGGTPEKLLGQIEPVLPGLSEHWNGKATLDVWPESRSYLKVGQQAAFGGIAGEPQGTCHFAGEHTSADFRGTLNGAVESGERAAAEILAELA